MKKGYQIDWATVGGIVVLLFMVGYIAYLIGFDVHKKSYENDIENRNKGTQEK